MAALDEKNSVENGAESAVASVDAGAKGLRRWPKRTPASSWCGLNRIFKCEWIKFRFRLTYSQFSTINAPSIHIRHVESAAGFQDIDQ